MAANSMAVDRRLEVHREVVWIHGLEGGLLAGVLAMALHRFSDSIST